MVRQAHQPGSGTELNGLDPERVERSKSFQPGKHDVEAGSSPVTDVDLARLAARLQRLEDVESIKRLIVHHAQGADRGNDVNVMLPLFTEDAVWDGGERFGVHPWKPAIREFLSQSGAFIGWTLHYMTWCRPTWSWPRTGRLPPRSGSAGRMTARWSNRPTEAGASPGWRSISSC